MAQATAVTPNGRAASNPKQRFADVYAQEHARTLKVLRAYPTDRASYQPHERSDTALQLAWRFVMENNVAVAALRGPLELQGDFPPPPPTFAAVLAAYEATSREMLETLERTPESRFTETVKFFTGPGQLGDLPVNELLWFTLFDSIHHRGQLSVYLRCAGGRVPSIYGPSADEPWM